MPRWPKLALFLSGLFFGGGLDHLIFIAMNSPASHYGLQIGVSGQLGFAALDFGIAAVLYTLNSHWTRPAAGDRGQRRVKADRTSRPCSRSI